MVIEDNLLQMKMEMQYADIATKLRHGKILQKIKVGLMAESLFAKSAGMNINGYKGTTNTVCSLPTK